MADANIPQFDNKPWNVTDEEVSKLYRLGKLLQDRNKENIINWLMNSPRASGRTRERAEEIFNIHKSNGDFDILNKSIKYIGG